MSKLRKGFFHMGVVIEIINMTECINRIEAYLDGEISILDIKAKQLECEQARVTDKEDIWSDQLNDEYWQLNTAFPEILRNSMFVTTYSLLEHKLNELCLIIETKKKYLVSYRDLNGDGIERAQKYLKKIGNIDFVDKSRYWCNIKCYNIIRNHIVHSNGVVKDIGKIRKIQGFVQKYPELLSLDDFYLSKDKDIKKIELKRGACEKAIADIRGLFDEINDILSL